MLKAILYYILLIAEFLITLFIGGSIMGIYMATGKNKDSLDNAAFLNQEFFPFVIGLCFLTMLVVWLTFGHYKFSKFSLGKVLPSDKWKAMAYTCMPIIGMTLAFNATSNLFNIDFLPKDMKDINYLTYIPFAVLGSFFSAYIFYGAIQEELIRCGKKKWIQLLTLCVMMLPASMMSMKANGDFAVELTFQGFITTCYGCWIYRSTIVLFAIYFTSNLVPMTLEPKPLDIVLAIVGTVMLIYGFIAVRKKMPKFLIEKEYE